MIYRLFTLLLIVLCFSGTLGQEFLALNKVCEGFFCEKQHLDLVVIKSGSASSLATVVPSTRYYELQMLQTLSTYSPASQTYYFTVTDPKAQRTQLFSYGYSSKVLKNVTIPYGGFSKAPLVGLHFDSNSNNVLTTYGDSVFLVQPLSGQRKLYFEIYNGQKFPHYVTGAVSSWDAASKLFSQVVFDNANCYYYYQVNVAANSTTISSCFSFGSGSLTGYEALYVRKIQNKFFAVQYNVLGANYDFINPANNSDVQTVVGFSGFAGLGWTFDSSAFNMFTYDTKANQLWALVSVSSQSSSSSALGAIAIPSGADSAISASDSNNWSNLQIIY